ncbi:selenophosphate synthase [Desulfopila aestuarii DSM 18488]|uniref:Selenophosphate synthase n=1 Tax=Desulfopila aestuarii DSM 18488 TaxID=1121416 RepID=A0A1M7Y6S2_9BACT|nr:selenophosphate synthase [Desulfopila aestuarii DSM 18488]
MGTATADDAGVYRVSDDLALIQTVDFFTPIVDDPYDFGRIAAANSLSDVYAMGGIPKTAMNIVAFPLGKLEKKVLREILSGGIEKIREAGAVLLGGHSIEDDEIKYGLSVTGYVHPQKILTNQGLRPGDCLVLTKPLGTGIIATAVKGGLASEKTVRQVTEQMATLNKQAAELMHGFSVSACTDVTGFGLLGHLAEMIACTGLGVTLDCGRVPVLPEALHFANMGFVPAGAHKNRQHRQAMVTMAEDFSPILRDILFDPQTSGGLLIGCAEKEATVLRNRLRDGGVEYAEIIGYANEKTDEKIELQ